MQKIIMNKIIPISKKAQKNYGWLDIQPYMPYVLMGHMCGMFVLSGKTCTPLQS
jgi:hypothetical protein